MADSLGDASIDPDEQARRAQNLSSLIKPVLFDQGPSVQGAALADLVAIYFAGHRPDVREQAIALWLVTMRLLIEPSVAELRERGSLPPGWERQ